MALLIPTFGDANYSIGVNLDGTQYLLTFRFSDRQTMYYVDLQLADTTPLVMGKGLVVGVSLWHRQRYNPLVPQGHMVAQVIPGAVPPASGILDDPPGLGDLAPNGRVALFYATKSEVGF